VGVDNVHSYATDSEEKRLILLVLAIVSVFLTWLLYSVLTWIGTQTNFVPPWWLEIPSVATFYGVLYAVFDRRLWKNPLVRKLGGVKTPDLSGTWKGYVKSSYDNFNEEIEATLEIFQSWTHIGIFQQTKDSKGQSFVATILTKDSTAMRLCFMYQNIPQASANTDMRQHVGSAELALSSDGTILSGDYFNCGRDRPTWGELRFVKLQNK
jgi:hypothetical protein